MAKKPARPSDGPRRGINDDIGEEMRLTMYRMQVVIRESEQRAFDLFLRHSVPLSNPCVNLARFGR